MLYLIPLLGPIALGVAAYLAFRDKDARPGPVAWQGEP